MRKGDKFSDEAVRSAREVPTEHAPKAVGRRLRLLQQYLDVTQPVMAEGIGIQQSKVSRYMNGKAMLPIDEALALCRLCQKHSLRSTRLHIRWLYEGLRDDLHHEFRAWLHERS